MRYFIRQIKKFMKRSIDIRIHGREITPGLVGTYYRIVPKYLGKEHMFLPKEQEDGIPKIGIPVSPTLDGCVQGVPGELLNPGYWTKFYIYKLRGNPIPANIYDFASTKEHRFTEKAIGKYMGSLKIWIPDCWLCELHMTDKCEHCKRKYKINSILKDNRGFMTIPGRGGKMRIRLTGVTFGPRQEAIMFLAAGSKLHYQVIWWENESHHREPAVEFFDEFGRSLGYLPRDLARRMWKSFETSQWEVTGWRKLGGESVNWGLEIELQAKGGKMKRIKKNVVMAVHTAIHKKMGSVTINGLIIPIKVHTTKHIRYAVGKFFSFWEQNPRTNSKYAELARKGLWITWIFRNNATTRKERYAGIVIGRTPYWFDRPEARSAVDKLINDIMIRVLAKSKPIVKIGKDLGSIGLNWAKRKIIEAKHVASAVKKEVVKELNNS